MKQLKNALMVVAMLFICEIANSQTTVELIGEKKQFVTEIIWVKPFNDSSKFFYYSRNTLASDFKSNTGLYSLNIISYDTKFVIDPLIAFEHKANGLEPRAGLQYFLYRPKLQFYVMLNVLLKNHPNICFFTNAIYRVKLAKQVNLYTKVELITIQNDVGNLYSTERFRLGLEVRRTQFGAAMDMLQYDNTYKIYYQYGIFLAHTF